MRMVRLKGKKHKFSFLSLRENREKVVNFPFSLFRNREEKNMIYVIFPTVNNWRKIGENQEEKNVFCVIFFRGKIGKKKTYPKGYWISFPCLRRSRGKVVVRKLSHDDSFP